MSIYKVGCCAPVVGHAFEKQAYASGLQVGQSLVVGLKVFHTTGDSERATRQIDVEMQAIIDAVYEAMGTDPNLLRRYTLDEADKLAPDQLAAWKDQVADAKQVAQASKFWPFFSAVVSPVYQDWQSFREGQNYYNLFTSWEEYEKWLERAKNLRDAVRSQGIRPLTPTPVDLSKTTLGALGDDLAGALKSVGSFVKNVVYALLVLVGGYVVYKFVILRR